MEQRLRPEAPVPIAGEQIPTVDQEHDVGIVRRLLRHDPDLQPTQVLHGGERTLANRPAEPPRDLASEPASTPRSRCRCRTGVARKAWVGGGRITTDPDWVVGARHGSSQSGVLSAKTRLDRARWA